MRWWSLPALAVLLGCGLGPSLPERPSFVVVVVDDLGWADLPSYGHELHRTPNIDRLAREGVRFTNAYSASPVCSPTRASLLTGRHPARLHLTHALPALGRRILAREAGPSGVVSRPLVEPRSANFLAADEVTMAERLRDAGYRTAFFGKWHLGAGDAGPLAQGFEIALGGEEEGGATSYFDPYGLSLLPDRVEGEYLTDRITDEAVDFLEEKGSEPFLLYVSHFAVHRPLQAKPEMLPQSSSQKGGRPPLATIYAAMLESVDDSVGRVLSKLEELGVREKTLVIVTSDNGGLTRRVDDGMPVTDNGALRGGKAMIYEGGLRVPLVAAWPGVLAEGTQIELPVSSVDLWPTLADAAGLELGEEEVDGVSFLPSLLGRRGAEERDLFFYYPHYIPGHRPNPAENSFWNTPSAAMRSGDWKMIRYFGRPSELYDLAVDPGESRNLAKEDPGQVASMEKRLDRWLEDVGAHQPRWNHDYDAEAFQQGLEESTRQLGASREWVPNGGCLKRVEGGSLRLSCDTHPFLVGPEMVLPGPLRVSLRLRTVGARGRGNLWFRAAGKGRFSGQGVSLKLDHDGEWHEHELVVPSTATIYQLRLDFGRRSGGEAEIDWIRVEREDSDSSRPALMWAFDDAPSPAA